MLGHYIDNELRGNFTEYLINYLKSILYFLYTTISIFIIFNKNSRINAINFLFRFLGRLIGPFIFNSMNFLKK